jgi:5-formyltetrahydrofolate cyclo-ligase
MYRLFNTLLIDHLYQVLNPYKGKNIGIFYPMHNEVDLRELDQSFNLYYPDILNNEIVYLKDIGQFKKAPFNTTVPDHAQITDLSDLDVIIVPGLVYDKKGYRIGYGKGYYDRLLKKTKALKIGVCFDLFLVDHLPIEAHDEAVDIIVTDQQILMR